MGSNHVRYHLCTHVWLDYSRCDKLTCRDVAWHAIISRRRRGIAPTMEVMECVMTMFRGTLKTLNEFVREPVSGVDARLGSVHVGVRKSESQ